MTGEVKDITVVKLIDRRIKKLFFSSVYIHRITSALQDKTALENNSSLTVRIFDEDALYISPGDKLFLKEIPDEIPYDEAFTVTSVRNNLRGTEGVSHVRIICS